jgi:hypothetical protein
VCTWALRDRRTDTVTLAAKNIRGGAVFSEVCALELLRPIEEAEIAVRRDLQYAPAQFLNDAFLLAFVIARHESSGPTLTEMAEQVGRARKELERLVEMVDSPPRFEMILRLLAPTAPPQPKPLTLEQYAQTRITAWDWIGARSMDLMQDYEAEERLLQDPAVAESYPRSQKNKDNYYGLFADWIFRCLCYAWYQIFGIPPKIKTSLDPDGLTTTWIRQVLMAADARCSEDPGRLRSCYPGDAAKAAAVLKRVAKGSPQTMCHRLEDAEKYLLGASATPGCMAHPIDAWQRRGRGGVFLDLAKHWTGTGSLGIFLELN